MKLLRMTFWCLLLMTSPVFGQKNISLEDIWTKNTFTPARIEAMRPAADGEHYYVLDKRKVITKFDFKSGSFKGILLNINEIPQCPFSYIDDYQLSADESKILVSTENEAIYRHSFKADYYSVDLLTKTVVPILENQKTQLASFSPSGDKVAYVFENNLYIKDLASLQQTQVTSDGRFNAIINGATDWVYEEEFGFAQAYSWSPAGDRLAFLRFDESEVKEFNMILWGKLYPDDYRYKYPKAGEANSKVRLFVYDLRAQTLAEVDLGPETDIYIPQLKWSAQNHLLSYIRMNRLQNELNIYAYDVLSKKQSLLYEESHAAYVEVPELLFAADGKSFFLTSEKSGFNQLYQHSLVGEPSRVLSKDSSDVTAIYGYDDKSKKLFYQAAATASWNRDLFVVLAGAKVPAHRQISTEEGSHEALFAQGFKYYVNTFSSANRVPRYSVHDCSGKQIKVLESNDALMASFKNHQFVDKKLGLLPNASGDLMPYWIMEPAQKEAGKKYPLLLFVYGGPGSQQVANKYGRNDYLWYQLLVSKGYVVACVDNRGTAFRGEAYKKSTYMQLGKKETEDQLAAARYFCQRPDIDASRVGIWGWSYGGFMSSNCLFQGGDVFKMAIAVAPVSNWRYYDNIYTERFMRRPQENASGYDDNSPIHHVGKMKGAFLLVHGTADDNVHFQNTVDLVSALNEAGKHYDFYMYPNKNHSILGSKTRLHLYQKMTDFILKNL